MPYERICHISPKSLSLRAPPKKSHRSEVLAHAPPCRAAQSGIWFQLQVVPSSMSRNSDYRVYQVVVMRNQKTTQKNVAWQLKPTTRFSPFCAYSRNPSFFFYKHLWESMKQIRLFEMYPRPRHGPSSTRRAFSILKGTPRRSREDSIRLGPPDVTVQSIPLLYCRAQD